MSTDIWTKIAAPLPREIVQFRQQGRPKARDGKFFAPFVAYIDAQFVRDRLDSVVPGEWDLSLELLPPSVTGDGEEVEPFAFKATLQILGVRREDVGTGKDYKTASTDAFKRAAVRFGVGRELYTDYEIVWVQVDGDGKYAKALEDPAKAYAKRFGAGNAAKPTPKPEPVRDESGENALRLLLADKRLPDDQRTVWEKWLLAARKPDDIKKAIARVEDQITAAAAA